MARAKEQKNGRLEEALVIMLQNMATLVQTQAAFVADKRETDKELADLRRQNNERFAQIDQRLATIEAVLREHNRILERLPDAVREKIGFKPPP
jgi:hypothetical protein